MNTTHRKNIALICHHSPYGGSQARELIDIALAGAAFEQSISLVFMGAGALQLIENQNPAAIEQKNLAKMLAMLALYDVDNILVHDKALTQFQLSEAQFATQIKVVDNKALNECLAQQDICMSL